MGLQLRLWSQSLHSQCGATIAIDASHVSQLWSSCHVCCSRGCSASGHGCGLHACCAMCVMVTEADAAHGVAIDAAHVSRSWHVGSWLWSSRVWHGATVTVNVAHVSWSWSSCRVMVTGAAHQVTVMVFACMVWGCGHSRCSTCVMVAGAAHWVVVAGAIIAPHALWLSPLHCMWCHYRPFHAM